MYIFLSIRFNICSGATKNCLHMFWLRILIRYKKNNFLLHSLIWRPVVLKCNDAHDNIAYLMTKSLRFHIKNAF